MKKVLLLTGIIILAFTIVACSNNEPSVTVDVEVTTNDTEEEVVVEAPTEEPVLEEKIPNYLFKRANGETFNIHDYEGKIIILNFWASW